MPSIDYEAEYDNRARVPEHPAIFGRWEQDAAAYRERDVRGRPRGAWALLRPERAAIHRPVQAGTG